ncbi:hypothetical protein [Fusobacterium sp.]|uniref:hypothetical protein n=1 Tax=Fusobacterium sp. TaxID=68766 RepID=UPI00396C6A24
MKKLLLLLSLLFIFGCGDGTDIHGFYMAGENKGIHKETKTRYDKDGFDIDGWSENKLINKVTKSEYGRGGYDYYGFNEKGIHKITGFNFDEKGFTKERCDYSPSVIYPYNKTILKKPYIFYLGGYNDYIKTEYDKFDGVTYIGISFYTDFKEIVLALSTAVNDYDLCHLTNNLKDHERFFKSLEEFVGKVREPFSIDIITNDSPDHKVNSYFRVIFFSSEKQNNLKLMEFLVDGSIIKIDDFVFNSHAVENSFIPDVEIPLTVNGESFLYLNQIDIPVTDDLFNVFAKLEKDQEVDVRIITDEERRFTWTNKIGKDMGLPIGLGKYYQLKYKR